MSPINKKYNQKLFNKNTYKPGITNPSQVFASLITLLTNYITPQNDNTEYEDYCEDEPMTDDDYEDMWAHYDYLEALYD